MLKQKYGDEKVLVIRASDIDLPEGFSRQNIDIKKTFYIERYKAEYNPLLKQIIPYCLIKYKNKYFVTRRLKGSGESRLVGLVAMPGGHINECDFENPVMNAIRRELKEELGIKDSDIKNYNFEGIIYSNIDLVSQDHIGLVYTVFLNNDNIQVAETKSLTGEWMTIKQFAQLLSDMENWCRIVFNSLLWQVT